MGGYKPTQIMLLQKQETKTTIGEWDWQPKGSTKVSREDQDEFAYNSHMKA
jgi:acetyl-CoA acetyltransferase